MRLAPLLAAWMTIAVASGPGFVRAAPEPAEEREPPPQRVEIHELERRAAMHLETVPVGFSPVELVGSPAGLDWFPLGPRPIGFEYWAQGEAAGRVSAIVVDPRDPAAVYVAAAQGGVWKSTDSGASWTPLTDALSSLASGALALDPSNPDVVYYGTGEQHYSGDSFYGDGLYRSTDGGATWVKIASAASVGSYIARVSVNAADPNVLMVASNRGLVRSTDAGATWSVRLFGGWANDLVQDPANPGVAYTSLDGVGVHKTTDGGATWSRLGGGLPGSGYRRINLALAPSDPLVLYASFVAPNGALFGMYRTTDGGATWALLAATPNYLGTQGWYDNCLAVDPANPNVCYAGGVFPYNASVRGVIKTTDGGASWTDITAGAGGQVHPDQHVLVFGPDGTLWLGNDGGVWKSTNGGTGWINRNHGLGVTQFYTLGLHPSSASRVLGGTQDNGTLEFRGLESWSQVMSGDGGPTLYAWHNPDIYYTTYVFLDPLFKFYQGTLLGSVTGPWGAAEDRADWCNGPLVTDPNVANRLLAGTYRVWRSLDGGATWGNALSGDLTGGNGVLRAIAVATGASNTIYTGSSDGRVYHTTNASQWTLRNAGLPVAPIPDVVVSPANPQVAYLCADRSSAGRVFRTTDAGLTWTDLTGDLPAGVRALSLAVDFRTSLDPRLYLGTDFGVYVSANLGRHWVKASANFPNCAVYDIGVDPVNNHVVAATHGRGMWRASPDVTAPAVTVATPNGGEVWFLGESHDITWSAGDAAGIDSVTVLLSTDGGLTYQTTLAGAAPNTGALNWTVPTSMLSATSRVKVVAYDPSGNGGADVSDGDFYIADPALVGVEAGKPVMLALHAVRPHPARAPVALRYDLPRPGPVSLEIHDLLGRRVRSLERGGREAGRHEVAWDGRDESGQPVGAGVYYYRLRAGPFERSRRMVLVR